MKKPFLAPLGKYLESIGGCLVLAAIISFVIIMETIRYRNADLLQKKGVLVAARITSVYSSRGSNIKFVYNCNNKLCHNRGTTSDFEVSVGDSILIRVMPNDPEGMYYLEGKVKH